VKIVGDSVACRGCRVCELACSLHHKGYFAPEAASIKVYRDNQNGEVRLSIDSTCDVCRGKHQPLCVKYCAYGALRKVG